jgi:hypothetical protein
LTTCEIASICDYLSDPNGVVTIFDNASGCNSPPEIARSCGFTMPCLPFGNYFFNNQADIDNFNTNYQDCTELNGNVKISGNDITNLYGLSDVTSIGYLVISENPLLINLSGLNSLTSVTGLGGIYIEDNPTLTSLEGLESLTSNGGQLVIESNDALSNLMGLENLAVIEKFLSIRGNANLISLDGLDSVDTNSITHLYIENNNVLSSCAVTAICNYLASPHGDIRIEDNAPGCNSQEEVEDACDTLSVREISLNNDLSVYPNPCSGTVCLRYQIHDSGSLGSARDRYLISDLYGIDGRIIRRIYEGDVMPGANETEIDMSDLPGGLYFLMMQVGDYYKTKKLVVIH